MDTPSTFLDQHDVEAPELLPPPPITDKVATPEDSTRNASGGMKAQVRYGHVLKYGTILSETWDEDWIRLVAAAEELKGRSVCGARRTSESLKDAVERGEFSYDALEEDPVILVCKSPSGLSTDHPGEGRCRLHGGMVDNGTVKTGQFSLLKHNRLAPRVSEYFEMEQLMDLRSAIAIIYAAMDEMLGSDEPITPERAQEIGTLMSKVGQLTKQHNDITASKQITIEVPEFMAWAEFFYELAIKYIQDGKGNVAGFLGEAQQFYNATVTLTIGDEQVQAQARRDGDGAIGLGSGVEVVGVSRTGVEES